jgi:hypothetical protein
MDEKRIEAIRAGMKAENSEELESMWRENNHAEWPDEAFEAARGVLTERGIDLPPQKPARYPAPKAPASASVTPLNWRWWDYAALIGAGVVYFGGKALLSPGNGVFDPFIDVGIGLVVACVYELTLRRLWERRFPKAYR